MGKRKKVNKEPSKDDYDGISALPIWELSFYLVVHISVVIYICACVYWASIEHDGLLNMFDFEEGWKILGRDKDISNYEWHFFYQYFLRVTPWYVGHMALARICDWNFVHKALNTHDVDGYKIYLLMFTLALLQLRYTSFCLEKVKRSNTDDSHKDINEKEEESHLTLGYGPIDMLFYVFYFPLFFTGPIMPYTVFSSQICQQRKPWTWTRVTSLCTDLCRILFWAFVNEICLHYFYFNALQHNSTIMQEINLWTMAGIGYCSGQFFMTKYTVMFGLPSIVAKTDDLEPPKGPKCISYIYLYSDMWKYFDRGMYDFMKRYIYVPLGGSRSGMVRQFTGSVLCFTFVYYWHGSEYYAFLWTVFNFIGITLEALGGMLVQLPKIKDIQVQIFYFLGKCLRRKPGLRSPGIFPLYNLCNKEA
ncbi:protein-cysteine N-palmitoyltransferase HHAT-like [Mizuhopecten yessoensis]|uniref:protein-cysteine N-palmitoyltransferase HHAT-like n=1 Tax=Mizuhopecten yessoensis TaxID=6573 RepID=UPI000B458F82|nr:protein-cysteine N-palmitoyltransferase HHAT-like [Mizuhopecten yessoensis]